MNRAFDIVAALVWMIAAPLFTVGYWLAFFVLSLVLLRWLWATDQFLEDSANCHTEFARLIDNFGQTWDQLLGRD